MHDEAKVKAEIDRYLQESGIDDKTQDMVNQYYHTGGDKHRLTLVNISKIEGWFDPARKPVPKKEVCILIVFCEYHAKLEDIDDSHRWIKDVTFPTPQGPVTFRKGEHTKCLYAYVECRKKSVDKSRFERLRIWGQKKAWCDTQVCVQISDMLKQLNDQCLVLCDCLGARWSKQSVFAHWSNEQIQVPYAPGATSFLQEPDTHQHAQIKAFIRELKSRMHFDMEMECKNQGKPSTCVSFGPREFVELLGGGLKMFQEKNPLSPLQGMLENHILAVRPSADEDGKISLKLLDDCKDPRHRLDDDGHSRPPQVSARQGNPSCLVPGSRRGHQAVAARMRSASEARLGDARGLQDLRVGPPGQARRRRRCFRDGARRPRVDRPPEIHASSS